MSLEWKGDNIKARVARAQRVGINKTMGDCVIYAKNNHEWQNKTGTAERSIRIIEPAWTMGTRSYGIWGSMQVAYFIFLELGTALMRSFPTLRPAAGYCYPWLAGNIINAYRGSK